MKSIISNEKECLMCGTTLNLHRHHIYGGTANRRKSESDGAWCYLCVRHHTGQEGVHSNKILDLYLKRRCQMAWEERFGDREAFIKRFGKSYL